MRYLILPLLVFFTYILNANPNQEILDSSENYIFKETSSIDLKVFIFKPDNWKASEKNPAIVFYFGGGWNSRHITQFVAYAQYYASRGYVCFIPNYRVRSSENSQAIDSVRDAQDAFAFVRKNANKFGIDSKSNSGFGRFSRRAFRLWNLKDET